MSFFSPLAIKVACLLLLSHQGQSTITLSPDEQQVHYVQGGTATLTCQTTLDYPVLWQYSKEFDSVRHNVFRRGLVINGFRNRITHDLSVPKAYTIIITNLQLSDSGVYICIEDDGIGPDQQMIRVTVNEREQTTAAPVSNQQFEGTNQEDSATPSNGFVKKVSNITQAVIISSVVLLSAILVIAFASYCVVRHRLKREPHNDVEKTHKSLFSPSSDVAFIDNGKLTDVRTKLNLGAHHMPNE